ncbi:uncharacterized protein PHACADRAFT_198672 [Phanerochaete carnosa HHB-10118-sp]|uniref:Uncharacterized protein n=1 Tax=Phanerochaete carnosa (strain HHB-10118-sp) TaxID=650164 RepID=K5URV2_PHACS|nr:uncharacterized protein PHACADRAFT_198672 [Phanerochaete carnosa HHB-10118-sp]EKM52626.1 hypothetical protein PHACADRAFT_198672 [Phanerochaete carnosa HHB-10118-sp]
MHHLPYRGRNNLMQVSDFEHCKHTSANWFLRTAGRSTTYMARLIWFTSGHFPHSAFHEHFNFEGNQRCGVDVETRDHIWFDCDLWIKKHKPPNAEIERMHRGERGVHAALDLLPPTPPGMSLLEHFLQDWRETPIALDDVTEFLRLNPIVGTFTWLELVDQALGDWAHGKDDSLVLLKVDLHTGDLTEFVQSYALVGTHAVTDTFEFDNAGVTVLQAEFGLAAAKAKNR